MSTTTRDSKRIPQTMAELATQTDEILAEIEAEERAAAKRPIKRILSVTVKREADYDADTSELGEYSDTPNDYAIVAVGEHSGEFVDRLPCECGHDESDHGSDDEPDGECVICRGNDDGCDGFDRISIDRGREYRYYNPPIENYEGIGDEEMRKYCQQDYARLRDYGNGWCYMGVTASAQVQLGKFGPIQVIRSGGLWGIESDSGDDYFVIVETEQLAELRDQLHAIGFSRRAVTAAMRNVQHQGE